MKFYELGQLILKFIESKNKSLILFINNLKCNFQDFLNYKNNSLI